MRALVKKWNKESKSKALQVKFVVTGFSDMKSLSEEIKTMYDRVQSVLNVLAVGDTMKLRQMAEAEKARAEKERKAAAAARRKQDKQMQALIQQLLNEKGEEKISQAAASKDSTQWEKLEKEVEARGLSSAEAHKRLSAIRTEVSSVASKPQTLKPPSGQKKSRSPSPARSENEALPTILIVDRTNGGMFPAIF